MMATKDQSNGFFVTIIALILLVLDVCLMETKNPLLKKVTIFKNKGKR